MLFKLSIVFAIMHILHLDFSFLLSSRICESEDFLSDDFIFASTRRSIELSVENGDVLVEVEDEDDDCVPLVMVC